MKVQPRIHYDKELGVFLRKLGSPAMQVAAARGLNEHAEEQRRQSVTSITSSTGVPKARIGGKMRVRKAAPGPVMQAEVRVSDTAIPLAEYGNPVWNRTMPGVQATMNRTTIYKGTFLAKGQILRRTSKERYPLKALSHIVPANELAKPDRPNVAGRLSYARLDLEKRVTRHVLRAIGV